MGWLHRCGLPFLREGRRARQVLWDGLTLSGEHLEQDPEDLLLAVGLRHRHKAVATQGWCQESSEGQDAAGSVLDGTLAGDRPYRFRTNCLDCPVLDHEPSRLGHADDWSTKVTADGLR